MSKRKCLFVGVLCAGLLGCSNRFEVRAEAKRPLRLLDSSEVEKGLETTGFDAQVRVLEPSRRRIEDFNRRLSSGQSESVLGLFDIDLGQEISRFDGSTYKIGVTVEVALSRHESEALAKEFWKEYPPRATRRLDQLGGIFDRPRVTPVDIQLDGTAKEVVAVCYTDDEAFVEPCHQLFVWVVMCDLTVEFDMATVMVFKDLSDPPLGLVQGMVNAIAASQSCG